MLSLVLLLYQIPARTWKTDASRTYVHQPEVLHAWHSQGAMPLQPCAAPLLTAMRSSQPPIACSNATVTALSLVNHPSNTHHHPAHCWPPPNQSRLTCRGLLCLPPPGLGCRCRCPASPACAACAAQRGEQTHQPWQPQGQASAGCKQRHTHVVFVLIDTSSTHAHVWHTQHLSKPLTET